MSQYRANWKESTGCKLLDFSWRLVSWEENISGYRESEKVSHKILPKLFHNTKYRKMKIVPAKKPIPSLPSRGHAKRVTNFQVFLFTSSSKQGKMAINTPQLLRFFKNTHNLLFQILISMNHFCLIIYTHPPLKTVTSDCIMHVWHT